MDKPSLVRKFLSKRGKTPREDVRRAKVIRQNRMCRHCRWRRDGVDICVLPRCFLERGCGK